MNYPYLVKELQMNLSQIKKLDKSMKELLNHIIQNATIKKGRFTTQPTQQLVTPLERQLPPSGGKNTKRRIKKNKKFKKQKTKSRK